MIKKKSYVFILGAGSNYQYKFPLGLELYNSIKNNYASKYTELFNEPNFRSSPSEKYNLQTEKNAAQKFCSELNKTTEISIDKYLNINKKFKTHGTIAIATEIYNREIKSTLPLKYTITNDWYSYLYQKIIQEATTEEILNIHENEISFITFNYDRSLEHFLFENLWGLLQNANIAKKQLAENFNKIPFIHVYGSIGKLPWQVEHYEEPFQGFNDKWIVYGDKNYHPLLIGKHSHDIINLMYDERKSNQEIIIAHKLIKNADRILFLGFGYDRTNLEILNLPTLLNDKEVYGTAYKNSPNEILHIEKLLKLNENANKGKIINCDCFDLLRDYLIPY